VVVFSGGVFFSSLDISYVSLPEGNVI
jgi:hypothetical protein